MQQQIKLPKTIQIPPDLLDSWQVLTTPPYLLKLKI